MRTLVLQSTPDLLPSEFKLVLGLQVCKSEATMEENIKHRVQYIYTHDELDKLRITVWVVRNACPVNHDQNKGHC